MTIESSLQQLERLGVGYAFYYRPAGGEAILRSTRQRFSSASIIKVPILLAWLHLERQGLLSREEICDLDSEEQVQGAGIAFLMRARRIPFHDALLMMISLSDNLCTNLVAMRIGLERLNRVFQEDFGLKNTAMQRRLFDLQARERGLDNWISPEDCVRFFDLLEALPPADRAFADSLFGVCQDDALLMRRIPRDTITFCHKTGSITGVLHDWGYLGAKRICLLTQGETSGPRVFEVFGQLGELLLEP